LASGQWLVVSGYLEIKTVKSANLSAFSTSHFLLAISQAIKFELIIAYYIKSKRESCMIEYLKSQGVKYFMNDNPKIKGIAEILEVKLKPGEADLTVKLRGETEPVSLFLNYTLERNVLCITSVKISKEWLNALANIFKEKYSRINLSDLGIKENGIKANLVKLLL
jgi:hypothetical protein